MHKHWQIIINKREIYIFFALGNIAQFYSWNQMPGPVIIPGPEVTIATALAASQILHRLELTIIQIYWICHDYITDTEAVTQTEADPPHKWKDVFKTLCCLQTTRLFSVNLGENGNWDRKDKKRTAAVSNSKAALPKSWRMMSVTFKYAFHALPRLHGRQLFLVRQ